MFASAYDKQARVLRLPNQDGAGIPGGELHDPVGSRGYIIEHRSDRPTVGVFELFAADIHQVHRRGETLRG